jgi:signal transduction histidine kinase
MRTLLGRLRALDPARGDALLALAYLAESAVEVLVFIPGRAPSLGWGILVELAMGASLALRRRTPVGAAVIASSAFIAIATLPQVYQDHLVSAYFALLFVIFSAGRHLDDRKIVFVAIFGTACDIVASAFDRYDDSLANVVTGIVFSVWAPLVIGRFMRQRARLHEMLREKTERLELERGTRAETAAQEERARIAGELHDVVAHALSAMVVQAAGARVAAERDPTRAAAAFHAVEGTGREALTEIRRLLGVLRRDDEEIALAPQPSLRHVGSLVTRVRTAGLPVDLTVEGDERELPAGIDLTAYRVIQGALKAALEEGHAGHANVRVRFGGEHVSVRVEDDGASAERPLPGVPERVALYGGKLESAARLEGGHVVRARLPMEGVA